MCMMVYIAAKEPLELIAWDRAQPAFHVSEISDSDFTVRQQFGAPYVLSVGSHSLCGCGFQYGPDPQSDEELPLIRASLDAFTAYLTRQLQRVPSIELYACWDGNQSPTPAHRRTLTPSSLDSREFYFLRGEFSIIEPDDA